MNSVCRLRCNPTWRILQFSFLRPGTPVLLFQNLLGYHLGQEVSVRFLSPSSLDQTTTYQILPIQRSSVTLPLDATYTPLPGAKRVIMWLIDPLLSGDSVNSGRC
jgi:hypothetical protein